MPSLLRQIALLASLALLSACILVDDFGNRWQQASLDPCLEPIAKSLYVTEFRRDPGATMDGLARALTLKGHHYLLLKKSPDDKGGRLYRFTITAGKEFHARHAILQRWRLDPAMREVFARDYPNAPATIDRDTVTLPNLEGTSEELVTEIANKPEYWQIDDQMLYNTLRDPRCRFDTRDLSEEADKFRPGQAYKNKARGYRGEIEAMPAPKGVQ